MKKLDNLFYLLSMLLLVLFSSCSSTKYGAHFQSSSDKAYAYQQKEKEVVPVANELKVMETEAEKSAIKEVKSNIEGVASLKGVTGKVEMPSEEELTSRQQKVLAETRERLQNMSRKEKRELRKEIRKISLSDYTKDLPAYQNPSENLGMNSFQQSEINTLLLVIITILIPPLGVFLHQGGITNKFWISLLLTLLFYVPGLIYSLIVVLG